MAEMIVESDSYAAHFELIEQRESENGAWFAPQRKAAFARFSELGFPTIRDEEWRYTNVSPIAERVFTPATGMAEHVTSSLLAPYTFGRASSLLVFVDGRYAPDLSSVPAPAKGVLVANLAEAMLTHRSLIEPHLGRYTKDHEQAFTALNTALLEDGALVHVPAGVVIDRPIHLLYVSTGGASAAVSHPRNLIVAEANSRVSVVESYAGLNGGAYFTNVVTEIAAGEDAVVDHYRIGREGEKGLHISTLQIHQDRSSNVTAHGITFGGRLVRHDINAVLDGEGAECTLNGLYVIGASQHVDNHLTVVHAKPHCDSREFFKGVLDGKATGIFRGRIIVREDAQKTDAKQTNMSLLLSPNARIESKPQLEIFADDVKCTHGATVGQISEEAVFYLRSRGLSESMARAILIYAFARESVDRLAIEPLRAGLVDELCSRLPEGELLREAL